MKNEKIQILKVEPGKSPVFTEIENTLVLDGTGRVFDIICGTFFLCLAPRNSEHFTSLPKMFGAMFEKYMIDHVDVK